MKKKENSPSPLKEAQNRVTPEKYKDFLKQIDLTNIFVRDVRMHREFDVSIVDSGKKLKIDFNSSARFENYIETYKTYGTNNYIFTIKSGRKNIVKIELNISAEFRYKDEPFNEDYFSIFNSITLEMMLYPYARLLINRFLSDSNLAFFTLPMMKKITKSDKKRK